MSTVTTKVLNSDQRRYLDAQTQSARVAAQRAAEDALRALAVAEPSRPGYLSDEQNKLRVALRDKARQLGDDTTRASTRLTNLVHDIAYEQWHRLLFARFLEVNGLLRHAEYREITLTLEDCGDLASDLGEPDGWAVAARFASEILPGVFRLTDPAVQVRFAAEHRNTLERLLLDIPSEVFRTEDALGWVYQFWQTAEKKRVNESGVKISGADLSPVTQLFTENYMVRFLLENSLGAWWATLHPNSSLIADWVYLRRTEDGAPAAGLFNEWPDRTADVKVIDPCCGSGHFLVAMFGMLWRMRAEEEDLTPADAQDAVLRDNLHGLELDPRCAQIAAFNVTLEAWKQGGVRQLPVPQIACSGVPIRSTRGDWEVIAGKDSELRKVLGHLHSQFRNADSLGSLIEPRADGSEHSLFGSDLSFGVSWDSIRESLSQVFSAEAQESSVVGYAADDIIRAAKLLSGSYTLVATNPPFLSSGKQAEAVQRFTKHLDRDASGNLAYSMLSRWSGATTRAFVIPQSWRFQTNYSAFRKARLSLDGQKFIAALGVSGFSVTMWDFHTDLLVEGGQRTEAVTGLNAAAGNSPTQIAEFLTEVPLCHTTRTQQMANTDHRITLTTSKPQALLSGVAPGLQGIKTGDDSRFRRYFWEVSGIGGPRWQLFLSSVSATEFYAGRSYVVAWDEGKGAMAQSRGSRIVGKGAWGKVGVLVSQMGDLPVTLYTGELFDTNASAVVPYDESLLSALWHFLSSPDYSVAVREIDTSLKVTNATLAKVPFDTEHWSKVAEQEGPLPEPYSPDPTQALFRGDILAASHPLQVAIARLLGYSWPQQTSDAFDHFADSDGFASLQALPNEPDLATRLRALLSTAYGDHWSSGFERTLITDAGGKNGHLNDWLRDTFFAQHVKVFENRPFLWHIWDGRKDGFSAIVNYHKLDRQTLEKLTFTSLGAWINRQKHEARAERSGASERLAAAEDLQHRLQLILDGVPPYDIYVRWKEMADQPIGWEPDTDDGVRFNIRPFVIAGVLRSKVNVHWRKDRGKNPDGTDRNNDLHPALEERRVARREAGIAE
ncbi:BREX-1 system adenine-specific DNA-methyltransferase PglX [Brevibacterium sp. JSBI002]|uniref:BREX-1 system adenine-specific DNA-methyltransferase PglX n=1 Tax=Brevibacterium sp. JSBI002 TaxID=2886045 RepID=UPI00222EDE19|nr:BREX-1 system adenine-specific DNA-methyltransferase PglX [Brevibacterium sp. JSBI002]UZD61111.1 BREX-1 system adenine-specific DNA-methyltransferase PglX [Brevibacterium sp. JSBI002]